MQERPETYQALREVPAKAAYGRGDVLVLFGELFGRGYANGIVDEARKAGMTIVGATVGRRDADGALRPLQAGELAQAEAILGGRILNVPLEAGFDLEPGGDGPSPVEQLKAVKPGAWQSFSLDWDLVWKSREAGACRFERNVEAFVAALDPLVPEDANILFVHTMAGGFPRARVYMPLMSRMFRTTGDKFLPSREFWQCDLGRLWAASFDEVTGRTFERLLAATASLRARAKRTRYVAYGYHGCEVLIGGTYTWQTYVPYLQGWAKMLLERIAREAWRGGVKCTVFNSPEIWTNSSAHFLGVEVSIYPLLRAIGEEGAGTAAAEAAWDRCAPERRGVARGAPRAGRGVPRFSRDGAVPERRGMAAAQPARSGGGDARRVRRSHRDERRPEGPGLRRALTYRVPGRGAAHVRHVLGPAGAGPLVEPRRRREAARKGDVSNRRAHTSLWARQPDGSWRGGYEESHDRMVAYTSALLSRSR